jgi:phosphate transport system protein
MSGSELRRSYHQRLDGLGDVVTTMATRVVRSVRTATDALLEGDLAAADQLLTTDKSLDESSRDVELEVLDLLALQAPVARELRYLLASQRIAQELQLSGHLATGIAQRVASVSQDALNTEIRAILYEMGAAGTEMTDAAIQGYARVDTELAREVLGRDEHVADMQRRLLRELFAIDEIRGVEPIVELGLVARFYGRIADHAVVIAERVLFIEGTPPPIHL